METQSFLTLFDFLPTQAQFFSVPFGVMNVKSGSSRHAALMYAGRDKAMINIDDLRKDLMVDRL